jgi:gluconokinase
MIILVMGVSGSGKTTIGQLLAKSLNWEFCDADALHPAANIEKMSRGIPLDDADRKPWLQRLQQAIAQWLHEDKNMVLACSALKVAYRQILLQDKERVRLVYLKGDFKLIQERLRLRPHHYMSSDLLQSQFDTLEEPSEAIHVDVSQPLEMIVLEIKSRLGI